MTGLREPRRALPPAAAGPSNDNDVRPNAIAAAMMLAAGRSATVALPLDLARHLRLRIACAANGRSGAVLPGAAIERYLQDMPAIQPFAAGAESGAAAHAPWSDV